MWRLQTKVAIMSEAFRSSRREEVQLDLHPPLFEQPFGNIHTIPIVIARVLQFCRRDVVRPRESQACDLDVELGMKGRYGQDSLAPIRVSAFGHDTQIILFLYGIEVKTALCYSPVCVWCFPRLRSTYSDSSILEEVLRRSLPHGSSPGRAAYCDHPPQGSPSSR